MANNADEVFEINPKYLERQDQIGAGATAEVFRGIYHEDHGDRLEPIVVAIKVIDWNKSHMGVKEQQAFDREVGIMPKIKHDHLVRFFGVTSLCKPFQIVTEFCGGGCCFELLHNCEHIELEWEQQLKMCRDVAHAMEYLHSFDPQIIHRDLKSLNLLLAQPVTNSKVVPMVKVSDFGLSRMKDKAPEAEWGKMTIAAGTCHWMAPEVFAGKQYDEKADVYSYSMILFEIICREIPFEEEEPGSIGHLTVQGHRPDKEAIPPDCPSVLQDLMLTCWDNDPPKRPSFSRIVKYLENVKCPPPYNP